MRQLRDPRDKGKILSWKKRKGEAVKRGDILPEVETEKANLEMEWFQQGVWLKILIPADTVATVGDVIAVMGHPGEQVAAGGGSKRGGQPAWQTQAAPQAQPPVQRAQGRAPVAAPPPQSAPAYQPPQAMHPGQRGDGVKPSPLARKMAGEGNMDLNPVGGTGPEGRIVRKDLNP